MKNILFSAFLLCFMGVFNVIYAQHPLTVTVQTEKEATDTIQFRNKMLVAIWIEDLQGNFVKTLALYSKNINHRKNLVEFTAKNPAYNTLDACTGATILCHDTTITALWNGKDTLNNMLPKGKYIVRCEQTSHNNNWLGRTLRPLTSDTVNISESKTDTLPYALGFKLRTYTTFKKSNDAYLKSLALSTGTLNPAFDSSVTDYIVNLSNEVTTLNITAQAHDTNASVIGTGEKDLQIGENIFIITVIAQDSSSKDYLIRVSRSNSIESINTASKVFITVFPNPTTQAVNIKMEGITENAILYLFNMQGQKVMQKEFPASKSYYSIPISHLEKGIYTMYIKMPTNIFMQKLIIQ